MTGAGGIAAVLLDRDGTVNLPAPPGRYVTEPSRLELLPGAGAAIRELNAAGIMTILVTNQRWLADSPDLWRRYRAVDDTLTGLLARHGARLDARYVCPHGLGACICRKPLPGLLQRAMREHRLAPENCVMIGDADSDVAAGRAAGVRTIRLGSPPDSPSARGGQARGQADFCCADLETAVRRLLPRAGRGIGRAEGVTLPALFR